MAVLVKMKSGARHFLKGDRVPSPLDVWFWDWWNPFCWCGYWFPDDFFGERIALVLNQVESMMLADDQVVKDMVLAAQRQSSSLIA